MEVLLAKAALVELSEDCRSASGAITSADLPADLEKIADYYNALPEDLKDQFNRKPEGSERVDYILEQIAYALTEIEKQDRKALALSLVRINENHEALKHDLHVWGLGKQYGEYAKKKAELAKDELKHNLKIWSKEATKIRATKPDIKYLPLAKRICENLGLPDSKIDAIRRKLREHEKNLN